MAENKKNFEFCHFSVVEYFGQYVQFWVLSYLSPPRKIRVRVRAIMPVRVRVNR